LPEGNPHPLEGEKMDSPEERVSISIAESGRLQEYLSSLPPEAWSKPSACDRWEVRDVVAHLGGVAEAYIQRIHESLRIDLSTYEEQSAPGPVSADVFADQNAERAVSRRKDMGDKVFSDFVNLNDALNHLMSTLGSQDWDRPHYYSSLGTIPMRYRPDLWISELAVHGWDIRSRLEPEAHFSDESLPVLMDVIVAQLTVFFFKPRADLPAPMRFRWVLTGPGARNSDIVVERDRLVMSDAGPAQADVTFQCDLETFLLIAWGRLTIDSAVAADRLTVHGDNEVAPEFERSFAW